MIGMQNLGLTHKDAQNRGKGKKLIRAADLVRDKAPKKESKVKVMKNITQ